MANQYVVTSDTPGVTLGGPPRTELGLAGTQTIPSAEGGPWYTVGGWHYVASEWPGVAASLRCEGFVTTDGLTAEVRLVRADTGAIAHATGFPIEIDSPDPVTREVGLVLADGVIYLLQARFNIVDPAEAFTLFGARIHLVRS